MLLRQLNYCVVILFVFFFCCSWCVWDWIQMNWCWCDQLVLPMMLRRIWVSCFQTNTSQNWNIDTLNWTENWSWKRFFLFVLRSNCFRLLTMQSFRAVESFSFLTTILQISLSKTNLTVRLIFAQFVHFYGSLFCFYSFVINLLFLSGFPLFFLLFLVSWFPILI